MAAVGAAADGAAAAGAASPWHERVAPQSLHSGVSHVLQQVHVGHQPAHAFGLGGGACAPENTLAAALGEARRRRGKARRTTGGLAGGGIGAARKESRGTRLLRCLAHTPQRQQHQELRQRAKNCVDNG